jgi:hypothetical protein
MSEEQTKSPSPFPIHIGIKMATNNKEQLETAWANGETPLEWNGSAIIRVKADLGGHPENGRITFVYDFRHGDLLGIEETVACPDYWSSTNPVHCTQLSGDMDHWSYQLSVLVDWDREKYVEEWSKCAASGNWSPMQYLDMQTCEGERFKQLFNSNWIDDEEASEDDPASLAKYDSFAALYKEAWDKLDDSITEEQLDAFEASYPKPKAWCVDEEALANVVRAVLGSLVSLRANGVKGWGDYEE